jgi:AcrR family transcriptional regulator
MDQASPRRRPTEGGYARGEETRLRIIATAIPMFGRRGFDGVSTREIAAEAGVNPPALQYYFDSKEGLYRACAEHIVEQVAEMAEPVLARAERLLAEDAPQSALIEGYCAMVETMAEMLFGAAESDGWSDFFATEQAGFGPAIAMGILRERFVDRLQDTGAGIIGRLMGKDPNDPEVRIRFLAIDGQFKIFHVARRAVLACLCWQDFSPEQVRLIKSVVVEQTRSLLASLTERSAQPGV